MRYYDCDVDGGPRHGHPVGRELRLRLHRSDQGDPGPEAEHEKIAEQLKAEIAQARQSVWSMQAGFTYWGTERGESRRVDNQLRGRSGRQGDPGKSRFYVSLEDDLMRIFGQGLDTWLKRFGIGDDEAIEHQWITNAIAKAQERREGYNFDIRKQLIRYDDVLNDQRQAYAELRDEVLDEEDLTEKLEDMREKATEDLVAAISRRHPIRRNGTWKVWRALQRRLFPLACRSKNGRRKMALMTK